MNAWLRLVTAGLVWALCCTDALAVKLPAPLTAAQLAGTWVGPDESGAVLRLKIDDSGAGSLEVGGRGDTVERFQLVTHPQKDTYQLTFAVLIDYAAPRALTLSGAVVPGGKALSLIERFDNDDGIGLRALLVRQRDLELGLKGLRTKR